MLTWALFALLLLHGLIHGIGLAKAQWPTPGERGISRPVGYLWLAAGVGFVAAALWWVLAGELWWVAAAPALLLSVALISTDWKAAKFGLVPNFIIAVPLCVAIADLRSSSFHSLYEREVEARVGKGEPGPLVVEGELGKLPPLLQVYLQRAGVVGRRHVRDFKVHFSGTMKNGDAGWMDIQVDQHSVIDPPARIFLMRASLYGVPFEAYHLYADGAATMQVRIAGLFPIVDARGPKMNQSETVTFFNDLCLLAPAALLDAPITWETLDEHRVRGALHLGEQTVRAELTFDDQGDLVLFTSDDRFQSADGKTYRSLRWSTPVRAPKDFGVVTLPSRGDAIWIEPEGEAPYARFVLESIEYNVR